MNEQQRAYIEEKMGTRIWAYAPVIQPGGAGLGVAIANEPGYSPVPRGWFAAETYQVACDKADELNQMRGIDKHGALQIVASTMKPIGKDAQ